jgi:hypothetical protein
MDIRLTRGPVRPGYTKQVKMEKNMDKVWLVIKPETSSALEIFAQWVESQKDAVTLRGVRIMTSMDCHRRGDVVFLVETGERNLHWALADRCAGPWDGSILCLDDFDYLLGHSKELIAYDPTVDAAACIRKTGDDVLFSVDEGMYVAKGASMYELRQKRFVARYAAGVEHPHDVCAVTHSVEKMRTVAKHFGGADFSGVEMLA